MAHECPECGMTCHCGGDIDDICFNGTPEQMACTCCDFDEEDDDYPNQIYCNTCGYLYDEDEHEPGCSFYKP